MNKPPSQIKKKEPPFNNSNKHQSNNKLKSYSLKNPKL